MKMLIIDGVKYKLWIPKEEKQLEEIVKEHVKDIFGKGAIYFEKRKISSEFGIPSIPDGFVIDFISKKLYAIEIELSKHRYDHIVSQGNRHIDAIRDLSTRNKIVRGFKEEIKSDPEKKLLAENFVKGELFEFLMSISENPELVIIADEVSNDIKQAEAVFASRIKTNIRDFKTFEREGIGLGVHAHLFEPLYKSEVKEVPEVLVEVPKEILIISREQLKSLKEGEVVICPSKPDGVTFLLRYNAWGFVRIRRKPEYFALYVTHPESTVSFFGEVKGIFDPKDPSSPFSEDEARRYKEYKEGKKVIILKPKSLRKLDKGIPKGTSKKIPQGIKYVTLKQFINAKTMDDF
jgi:hypothetical protein